MPVQTEEQTARTTPTTVPRGARRQSALMRWPYLPYNIIVLTAVLAALGSPVLVLGVLLQGGLAGILLIPFGAWYLGALVTAAVYAVQGQDLFDDAHLARRLVRQLLPAARETAGIWIPVGVILAGVLGSTTVGGVAGAGAIALLAVALLALSTALVASAIAGCYTFRSRDLWRLAMACFAFRPLAALGVACLTFLLSAAVYAAGEWVLLFLSGIFAVLLHRTALPYLTYVGENHVR